MLHQHSRLAVAGAFTFGSVLGALFTGTLLVLGAGLLSPIPAEPRATLAIAILVLLALHAVGILCLNLPQRRRQIPQSVFHDRPLTAAVRFAAELGTGLRTYLPDASPHALAVLLLLAPGTGWSAVLAALLAAVGFGLGRSLVVALHTQGETVAVDHPSPWLRAAGLVTLATCGVLAAQPLI